MFYTIENGKYVVERYKSTLGANGYAAVDSTELYTNGKGADNPKLTNIDYTWQTRHSNYYV